MKRALPFLMVFCLMLSLCACGGKTEQPDDSGNSAANGGADTVNSDAASAAAPLSPVDGMRVALIPGAADDPLYAAAKSGAQSYAAQWGLELRCADELGQTAAIQQAMDEGVSAICVASDDVPALRDKLREATDAGICVCTWGADTASDVRALAVSEGTASVLSSMLVEMGVTSLREREKDVSEEILYIWNASQEDNAETKAWYAAAKEYIRDNYPAWVEYDGPYYADGESGGAVAAGQRALEECPGVDLVLCGDPAALTGMCHAAMDMGMTAADVTITGFCQPSSMLAYLSAGVCTRWGLWDCGMQSAMSCYLAAWLAAGNEVHVGEVVNIPLIGSVELLANSILDPEAETRPVNSGVVMLPERVVFTAENARDYHF